MVLGGGRGTRLFPLTKYRAKPAVPLAGKYRLIDIPISNCINSGLDRIYVMTQFLSASLHRHLRQTYRFGPFSGGFVELLAAQQTDDAGTDWYQGTADAVRKNLRYLEQPHCKYVLILSGDQLYRMDYRKMIQAHESTGAEVTIATLPVDRSAAKSLGVMRIAESGRVEGFLEKPQTEKEIDLVTVNPKWLDQQGIESRGRECLASMGIYLFNRDFLFDALSKTTYTDFGKEIFPAAIRTRHVQVFLFDDYWEDIGTIRAFYEANLSLANESSPFVLESPNAPIYSRARFLPPTIAKGALISGSMIADGCKIGKDVVIEDSVVGLRCVIEDGVTIRRSILMGADEREIQRVAQGASLPIGIGSGSVIEGAIVDKNCRIGKGVQIVNHQQVQDSPDHPLCVIRDGIPVVVKDEELPDHWQLQSS